MTLQIFNRCPKPVISLRYLKTNLKSILKFLDLSHAGLEITFCDDKFMRVQNSRFMGKSGTTDVLSFPSQNVKKRDAGSSRIFDATHLGDILISVDQARRQAKEQNVSLRKEIVFLIVHSVLHLIGYDHATRSEQLQMHDLESRIWRTLLKEKIL